MFDNNEVIGPVLSKIDAGEYMAKLQILPFHSGGFWGVLIAAILA